MKKALSSFLLGGLLLSASSAYAWGYGDGDGPLMVTSALTLRLTETYNLEHTELDLLSDAGGTIRIGVKNGGANSYVDARYSLEDTDQQLARITGTVLPGYKITSMSVSGSFIGELKTSPPGSCVLPHCLFYPGTEKNEGGLWWDDRMNNGFNPVVELPVANLNGVQSFRYAPPNLPVSNFDFDLRSWAHTTALPADKAIWLDGTWWAVGDRLFGYSSLKVDNMVVTFQVTAVPEPETYAMLLAGLGMLAGVARKRRNVRAA